MGSYSGRESHSTLSTAPGKREFRAKEQDGGQCVKDTSGQGAVRVPKWALTKGGTGCLMVSLRSTTDSKRS